MRKIKKWEVLEEIDVSPSSWFPLFKNKVKFPNGKVIDDYYLSKQSDTAMIVAFTKKKEMIFVKQYKHGAGDVIIELPAGMIRKGNTPEKEALLELEEETGYITEILQPLGVSIQNPTKSTARVYGFIARMAEPLGRQNFDENEDIEVVLIPVGKVDEKIKNGDIKASDTITFIKLAQLKAPELFR